MPTHRSSGLRQCLSRGLAVVGVLAAASSCAPIQRPDILPPDRPALPSEPPRDPIDGQADQSNPVITFDLPSDVLRPVVTTARHPLPASAAARVGHHLFIDMPVELALRTVLAETDIGVLVLDSDAGSRKVAVADIQGHLDLVVDRLCRAAGVWCSYTDGAVEVRSTETFSVTLPPVPELQDGIKDTVSRLLGDGGGGATASVVADKTGYRLTYSATLDQARRVDRYLGDLHNLAIVVFETWIAEIQLTESAERGIRFDRLAYAIGSGPLMTLAGGSSVAAQSALGFGAVYDGRRLSVDTLVSFLSTQGHINTIASPRLSMASGTGAEIRIGGDRAYVYQIGVLTQGTVATNGSVTTPTVPSGSGSLVQNTVQTKDLKTGTTLKLESAWQDGLVSLGFDLELIDLVRFELVQAGGVTMQLPETTNRKLKNRVSMQPGQALLLGGIRTARTEQSRQGLPVGGPNVALPTTDVANAANTELVVMIKPKVVNYRIRDVAGAPATDEKRP